MGDLGPGDIPHEKTDPEIAKIVDKTLGTKLTDEEQNERHATDLTTTWFGFEEKNGEPTLQDYGRYSEILGNIPRTGGRQYPGLASFIGQTGAGKSTLIKMLIDLAKENDATSETPVPGKTDDELTPTSGNVHLYPDPKTIESKWPLLYADCEGLDGGD
ncbi:MAG: hypothetical protein M1814_005431 [Vezdaea aestivalis]|nr:MAG: hypothetical protein M1814_005431 [Vezdaea aestivalis]